MADKRNPFANFNLKVDPDDVESALATLRERAEEAFQNGRFTKVRISYDGKQLLPDVPLAVFVAGQGATFWVTGPLTALLLNLGAGALLRVEFIHEADTLVQEGLALYLDGELEAAEAKYRQALAKRSDDPTTLYHLGTLLRVSGRKDEALDCLRHAAMGPEGHPEVKKAAEAVARMEGRAKKTL